MSSQKVPLLPYIHFKWQYQIVKIVFSLATNLILMGRQCRQYSDLKYMFLFSFIWAVFKYICSNWSMSYLFFMCSSKFCICFIFICCSDFLYAVQNFICRSEFLYAVQIFYMLFKILYAVQNFYMLFRYFICCSQLICCSKFLYAVQIFYMLIEMQIYFHKLCYVIQHEVPDARNANIVHRFHDGRVFNH